LVRGGLRGLVLRIATLERMGYRGESERERENVVRRGVYRGRKKSGSCGTRERMLEIGKEGRGKKKTTVETRAGCTKKGGDEREGYSCVACGIPCQQMCRPTWG